MLTKLGRFGSVVLGMALFGLVAAVATFVVAATFSNPAALTVTITEDDPFDTTVTAHPDAAKATSGANGASSVSFAEGGTGSQTGTVYLRITTGKAATGTLTFTCNGAYLTCSEAITFSGSSLETGTVSVSWTGDTTAHNTNKTGTITGTWS